MDEVRSINWKTVGVAIVAGAGSAAIMWSFLQKNRIEDVMTELHSMRMELNQLDEGRMSAGNDTRTIIVPPESSSQSYHRTWTTSSIASDDMYDDANDNASWYSSPVSSSFSPIQDSSPQEVVPLLDLVSMEHFDQLLETDPKKVYGEMLKAYEAGGSNDSELLWRLAKACHALAGDLDRKNPKKKELILEGRGYAQAAAKLDDKNFLVLKWAAIMTGSSTDYVGTKEKIEQGNVFKSFLDKALNVDSKEYSLLHMRGRYAYSVANLSWLEKKAASAFFATPPEATIDEALRDFEAANAVRPEWIENLLYIARCYESKKDKKKAAEILKQVIAIEPSDDSEQELIQDARVLLKKTGQ